MTETGKTEEKADLPLEGSPNQKKETSAMESADVPSQESSETAPSNSLLGTPTSSQKSDADCFKTPEPRTPTGASAKKRKRLTPEEKSLRDKERLDKRRKLEEEKQKKDEEKQKREQERLEKAKQREAERLKKEEEKQRQEQERLEKAKQKEEERLKKEEERLKKEEERKKLEEERKQEKQKKEEERLKREEEKKQKDEEKERERQKIEEKKAKQAQFFTKFFKKSSAPKVHTIENGSVRVHEKSSGEAVGADSTTKNSALFNPLPFQIKSDMAVAPLVRRKLSDKDREVLDSLFRESSTCTNGQSANFKGYLISIKKEKGKYGRTEIILKDSPEVQILDEEETTNSKPHGPGTRWRYKLLQFDENKRPAYWGTWKRKPKIVTARKPTIKEKDIDYDFDSDDEWEDEPEDGEEIGDSGEEADDQEEGDEEDEEGWMVPHGYLSDNEREGKNEDLESLKSKEKEFYKSLKEKQMVGIPFIITTNLSCYKMRLCPVFKNIPDVKKRKPRAPRKKPQPQPEEKKEPAQKSPAPVATAEKVTANPPQSETTNQRKSQRKRKIVDEKPNPYAKPPSGFMAMQLPSDDEEDMDWADDLGGSGSSDSGSGDSEMEDDDSGSSDSDEDLFIPIIPPKSKK